jgi:peptide/nickel transport system substrate-binding protein
MPESLWSNSPIELNNVNINPIGSGPYMVSSVNKQPSGIIDYYKLTPFKKFALGEPYIKNINLHFYQNEDDLVKALIDKKVEEISSISPLNAENLKERNFQVESTVLPRVFGLFFNQNKNQLFTDKTIVRAIDQAIDKDKIVQEVLLGYGVVIDSPIPPNMMEYQTLNAKTDILRPDLLKKIQEDLSKDGWKAGIDGFLEKTTTQKKKKAIAKLEFSISTSNVPELSKTAELIKQDLATIGIKVEVKTFETGNLNQNVIRPREYDALLFGEIINNESDLFAFWHSSQRKDPGLNVAMYTNVKVDKILESASATFDEQSRIKKYIQLSEEIKKDMPAVFLYSPDFIYVVSKNLKNFSANQIISPSDRYLNAYLWYTQTENIWKIFAKNTI